jgi:hypothetical protein
LRNILGTHDGLLRQDGERKHVRGAAELMPAADTADISVIFPAFELRGSLTERLRTWACEQTLARDRYRVVVGIDAADSSHEPEVKALLAPQDEIVTVPVRNEADLWNAAAERAGTGWLVIVEGHCLAGPGCLEALARWIAANPAAQAGNFAVGHREDYLMARLSDRWFKEIHARWRAPDAWPRLHRAGCAIRADLFRAAGSFEPGYGQFSAPLLSAHIHRRGIKIDLVPDAEVIHMDDLTMDGHHFDTADFVIGECEARSRNDPDFFERYFGPDPRYSPYLHGRRVAWRMLQAAAIACMKAPKQNKALARLLPRYAMLTLAGVKLRIVLNRLAVKLDEFAVDRLQLPGFFRWARFIRAHRRVVDLTRLEWAANRPASPSAHWTVLEIAQIAPDILVGAAYGLEQHNGRHFRWTEPVMLLRLEPSAVPRILRIETASLHGDPLARICVIVIDGRVLPADAITTDGTGTLMVQLPAGRMRAVSTEVAIVSSPLILAASGIRRWLGLPIFSIAVDATASSLAAS